MEIDINGLSEAELIALNHKIVERLRLLRQMKAHETMLTFKIGQRVWFESSNGERVTGLITRYNKKTVTIISENGERWNVSPNFLRAVEPVKKGRRKNGQGFQSSV